MRGEVRDPGYFRLTPYSARNREEFGRADRAHERVREWIEDAREPILFLTGDSGTARARCSPPTSCPALGEQGWLVVSARSYADPLASLRACAPRARPDLEEPAGRGRRRRTRSPRRRSGSRAATGACASCSTSSRSSLILGARRRARRFTGLLAGARRAAGRRAPAPPRPPLRVRGSARRGRPAAPAPGRELVQARGLHRAGRARLPAALRPRAGARGVRSPAQGCRGPGDRARPLPPDRPQPSGARPRPARHPSPRRLRPRAGDPDPPARHRDGPGPARGRAGGPAAHDHGRGDEAAGGGGGAGVGGGGLPVGRVRHCLLRLAEAGLVRPLGREQLVWEIAHDFIATQLGMMLGPPACAALATGAPLRRAGARGALAGHRRGSVLALAGVGVPGGNTGPQQCRLPSFWIAQRRAHTRQHQAEAGCHWSVDFPRPGAR